MELQRTWRPPRRILPAFSPTRLQNAFRTLASTSFGRFNSVAEEIITHSPEETANWGREFAKRLSAPVLVLLTGELGSGKTTLTKGIVTGLGAARDFLLASGAQARDDLDQRYRHGLGRRSRGGSHESHIHACS